MSWKIRVQNPSGDSKSYPIDRCGELKMRDSSISEDLVVLTIRLDEGPYPKLVIRARSSSSNALSVGGVHFTEAVVPPETPVTIGETILSLERSTNPSNLPSLPAGFRGVEWKTASPVGAEMLWMIRKSASTSLAIYLEGETGSGKEILARLVHAWSERASGPFIALNCGALPMSLAESELFGHAKGAFTGAIHSRSGALMQAHGGTLFLDEIADLPMDAQVKLLRFLENGEVRAVGSDRTTHSQVRIVCATHQSLAALVESGRFRRDLYYRLTSVAIQIPSLRNRPNDIALLAREFAEAQQKTLSPDAIARLKAHRWPGNVRELRHAIERAAGLAGPFVELLCQEHFAFLMNSRSIEAAPELEIGAPILSLYEMERLMLLRALRLCNGHRTEAAKMLGIARSTLFEMLKRHRIRGPRSELTARALLENTGLRPGPAEAMH